MRLPCLALLACLIPAGPSPARDDDARTRATLDRALLADARLDGPLIAVDRPLASLSIDLSTLDEQLLVPVVWSGGTTPVDFATRGRLSATPSGLFDGGAVALSLDLTTDTKRPLVIRCRVGDAEGEGLPHPATCGISVPVFDTADEARQYLTEPGQRPTSTVCSCDPGDGAIWTLAIPVVPADPTRLTAPAGEAWTLLNQGTRTGVVLKNGETSHSLRYTLDFDGPRALRLDAVLEGPGTLKSSPNGEPATSGTLAGRLRRASASESLRCEVFDPPPVTAGAFPDTDEETPSWQGTLTCRAATR